MVTSTAEVETQIHIQSISHRVISQIDKDSCAATSCVANMHGSHNWREDSICLYDVCALEIFEKVPKDLGILGMHVSGESRTGS